MFTYTGAGSAKAEESAGLYVPRYAPEERARRNAEAIRLLDLWAREGDEEEQRETMRVLREALGKNRIASNRGLFP
ncbi:MAG TPA: hypothetical protein VFT74_19630 [Isosphaeraceae bacterium]|nr:hypothetical protein [Isosphaeraceae bacterium]